MTKHAIRLLRPDWPRPLAAVSAAIAVVLVGCDPWVRIEGQVLNEAGKPVSPAEALVRCPNLCVHGISDSQGQLSGSKLGLCPMDCVVAIRAAGYETFVEKVKPLCVSASRGMCRLVHVEARLRPVGAAKATGSAE